MTKRIKYACILIVVVIAGGLFLSNSRTIHSAIPSEIDDVQVDSSELILKNRLKLKADSAKAYCKRNAFNIDYCFLVDFSIHSGKQRFFVWDFKGDSVKCSSLCAHGYGKKSTEETPVFSNVEGSYCSSLGKYKVGIRSYSSWGINVHYKLHGLEKSNSNAYKRIVVLHSYTPVPSKDIYPMHLPLGVSQGCPVISDKTMKEIDIMQKTAAKSTLLWAYY